MQSLIYFMRDTSLSMNSSSTFFVEKLKHNQERPYLNGTDEWLLVKKRSHTYVSNPYSKVTQFSEFTEFAYNWRFLH